jgi:multidrug efflux pump
MRVWLKPDRMAQLGIDSTDIANAITHQNQQFPVGRIGNPPTPYPITQTFPITTASISEPSQFDEMILRANNEGAAIVRVKDVGYAKLGAQSYSLRTSFQGKSATLIAIYQQPGANAIQVSKDVRATLETLSKSFPSGLQYEIALDTTLFVQASIHEVIKTFFEGSYWWCWWFLSSCTACVSRSFRRWPYRCRYWAPCLACWCSAFRSTC